MIMIDLARGWFNIFEIPTFDLEDLAIFNNEYMDKSSARISQLFNNILIRR